MSTWILVFSDNTSSVFPLKVCADMGMEQSLILFWKYSQVTRCPAKWHIYHLAVFLKESWNAVLIQTLVSPTMEHRYRSILILCEVLPERLFEAALFDGTLK